jgi:DNA repair protein RecN (Recombination protein N)
VLDELRVVNVGILEDVTIEPGPGLTVVSGETGAGKTMLLGALRLLTGGRAPKDSIGPNGTEASVEGRLLVGEREVVLARRVSKHGSRGYLNGHMVTNRTLDETTAHLIEIVGQNDRLHLLRTSELRALLDTDLLDPSLVKRYRDAWSSERDLEANMQVLGGDTAALERERDVLRYQLRDITSGGFRAGEDEALRAEAARLRNAGELAERLSIARSGLDATVEAVGEVIGELRAVERIDPSADAIVRDAEQLGVLASELTRRLREASEGVQHDPNRLEEVEMRLARLGELRRKYGPSLEDVLSFGDSVERRLEELGHLLESADTIEKEWRDAKGELVKAGNALTEARQAAASGMESRVAAHLAELGLAGARAQITVVPGPAGPDGADVVHVTFTSDPRMEPGPLERIASGGELSRVVLAFRLAADTGATPIVAFDEIDAGVGGETALILGRKLAHLAQGRQVLCVTHLPQVAAYADHHLVVSRAGTTATVVSVEGDERLRELSRMLAGLPESIQGRLHAQELLAEAHAG